MEFILLSRDGPGGDSMWSLFGSFFYILLVLAFIIGVCWFALRLMGRVRARGSANANLYLVESILVGSQNMIQLIKAGDKYLVVGVSKERVTLLCELDSDTIKEITPMAPVGQSFGKILERFTKNKENGYTEAQNGNNEYKDAEDDDTQK